jgi:hypothetical protein
MSEPREFIEVFLDLLPNSPKNDQSRENVRQLLRQRFDSSLDDAVERVWDLPPMVVRPYGEYLALLLEAREIFLAGHFYSCVAVCGIVGERLVKDVFRASVLIQKSGGPQSPSKAAFDQLERVEVNGLIRFLKEAALLGAVAANAAESLGQLRNQYAHARGKAQQPDALKAIKLLHTLVEDTVSVFKEFEVQGGVLVHKSAP